VRVGVSAGLVAVLAAALVAGARQPQREVLATATAQSGGSSTTTPSTIAPVDPVHLPNPHGRAIRAPASVSAPPVLTAVPMIGSIPEPALVAYQRSAAVIDAADPSCRLDWTLLAAIGQIESDQGRAGGSHLNAQGVAHPPIIGLRLDGARGTSVVRDTDAGRLDGDRRFDHAVGPMQFLPSTWAAVAVDGDDNGRRNVQDIDDASLGSAVYLCANHDDLSTKAGARSALLRYNHSDSYVADVLAIARDLQNNSVFAAVTTRALTFTDLGPLPTPAVDPTRTGHQRHHHTPSGHSHHWWADPPSPVVSDPPSTDPTDPPSTDPTDPPSTDPTDPPSTDPTDPPSTDPTDPPSTDPTDPPSTDPTDPPSTDPTDPPSSDQPPIIPDPLPDALAGFTADEVQAYDAAWVVCRPQVSDTWADDADQTATLRDCLAGELGVPSDDPDLATFLTWVATYEQESQEPSTG
jgi:hypothetical protein